MWKDALARRSREQSDFGSNALVANGWPSAGIAQRFVNQGAKAVLTFRKLLSHCSRLFLLAEFLESGIGAQRVPERIEPKKSRRNGRCGVKPADIGRL